ncbi:hypothetical protein HanRHA438_Chr03g0112661 [Helianthus annuus]|nr:hypothetical protein HanRHA438_Chr03g0112661 [Helianthus annuus]
MIETIKQTSSLVVHGKIHKLHPYVCSKAKQTQNKKQIKQFHHHCQILSTTQSPQLSYSYLHHYLPKNMSTRMPTMTCPQASYS